MSFFTANTIAKSSMLSCTLAALLLTTGCDKTPETVDETTSEASEMSASTAAETSPATTQDNLLMTEMTLDTVNNFVFTPLISSGSLNAEQVSCLESRDKDLGREEINNFYNTEFTDAELQELEAFYNSDLGEKLIAFGNEQIRIMSGEEVETPMEQPTKEEMAEIQTFMQSPVGAKYMQLNKAQGEGSVMQAMSAPIQAEFDRCNITVDLDAPQPQS